MSTPAVVSLTIARPCDCDALHCDECRETYLQNKMTAIRATIQAVRTNSIKGTTSPFRVMKSLTEIPKDHPTMGAERGRLALERPAPQLSSHHVRHMAEGGIQDASRGPDPWYTVSKVSLRRHMVFNGSSIGERGR